MEKTFKVTIKVKKGYRMPDSRSIYNAVKMTDHCLGATIKSVEVEEMEKTSKPKVKKERARMLSLARQEELRNNPKPPKKKRGKKRK